MKKIKYAKLITFLCGFLSVELFGSYSDMSAFKYLAFDNRREWYIENEHLREIWLETFEKYSTEFIKKGAEGVDLASRIYDRLDPREYESVMMVFPWWDYEAIRPKREKSRFAKTEVRFEITLAAMDGSTVAKFDGKGDSVKWETALKRAIKDTFEKMLHHYDGYDQSRLYTFPEFEKRFAGLEVLPHFGRQKALEYLSNGVSYPNVEGIYKSTDYFGRVPAEFLIIYVQSMAKFAVINLTDDLYGLKQGTVIGEFTPFEKNLFDGYFVDVIQGKFLVGFEFKDNECQVYQLTTAEKQPKIWNLTKTFTPLAGSQIADNAPPLESNETSINNDDYKVLGQGSGYRLPSTNKVLTNHHVIEGADTLLVMFDGSQEPQGARVLLNDESNDLALLEILDYAPKDEGTTNLDVTLEIGDGVGILGFPDAASLGTNIKYTEGIVNSTMGPNTPNWFQVNAEIYPGSSGGPVFSPKGDLIGVSVAKFTEYENVNYVIKAAHLISIFEQFDIPYEIGESKTSRELKDRIPRTCLIWAISTK